MNILTILEQNLNDPLEQEWDYSKLSDEQAKELLQKVLSQSPRAHYLIDALVDKYGGTYEAIETLGFQGCLDYLRKFENEKEE